MLVPPGPLRVLVATKPVEFRKEMDGLAAFVKEQLGTGPFLCVGHDYAAGASRRALLRSVAVSGRHII